MSGRPRTKHIMPTCGQNVTWRPRSEDRNPQAFCTQHLRIALLVERLHLLDREPGSLHQGNDLRGQVSATEETFLHRFEQALPAGHRLVGSEPVLDEVQRATGAALLREQVKAGRLDAEATGAVLEAAGHRAPRRREWPAGLTAREVEVLRLLARANPTSRSPKRSRSRTRLRA